MCVSQLKDEGIYIRDVNVLPRLGMCRGLGGNLWCFIQHKRIYVASVMYDGVSKNQIAA